jgi:hypothetical protein
MIKTISYTLNNSILTNELLIAYISKFWDDIFSPLILKGADKHLMVLCKVAYNQPKFDINPAYRTLGYLKTVNHSDKELYQEYLSNRLDHLNDSYTTNSLSEIMFSYIERKGEATGNRALLQDVSDKSLTTHRFNNLNLPTNI